MIVPFILGSKVDLDHAKKIASIIEDFDVECKIYVASAHKVPTITLEIMQEYNDRDEAVVYVTIAGRSNALSGVVAANTHRPVVACPPFKDKADYLANIHSTLQMPSETPSVTAVDPKNAAQAVLKMLALTDEGLATKIKNHMKIVKNSFSADPVNHD